MLAALAGAAALTPVADSDIWWHLAAGREMLRTGQVLRADPFSLSALGRPWADVHWLFQLLAHAGHSLGGLGALVLGKAALVALGALGAWATVRRPGAQGDPDPRPAAGALLMVALPAVLLAARHLLLVRPVILSLVFLSYFLWVLERDRAYLAPAGGRSWLLTLPLAQVVWANCQGLSALGPVLVASYAVGGGRSGWRWRAAALASCLAAGLATPFGLAGALLPLRLLARVTPGGGNVFSAEIAENVPPYVLERTQPGQMLPLVAVMLLVAASFAVARRPIAVGRLLACLAFAGLALMANRNVLLFYWVAVPLAVLNVAPAVTGWLARLRPRLRTRLVPAALAATVAALALGAGLAVRAETPLGEPAPFRVPAASARRIAAAPGAGRVFASDNYGGYLIWSLYPQARPYIDTRLVLRTADEYQEYLGLADHPARWEAFAARHRFDYVLLPSAYPDRYLGLIQELAQSPDWRLVHTDGTEVLFARADGPAAAAPLDPGRRTVTESILAELALRWAGEPAVHAAARLHLARLQLSLGAPEEALHALGDSPGEVDAELLRARCHLVRGELHDAVRLVAGVLARDDEVVAAHTLLAIIELHRGRGDEALPHLRRALELDPYDREARALLERLEAAAGPAAP